MRVSYTCDGMSAVLLFQLTSSAVHSVRCDSLWLLRLCLPCKSAEQLERPVTQQTRHYLVSPPSVTPPTDCGAACTCCLRSLTLLHSHLLNHRPQTNFETELGACLSHRASGEETIRGLWYAVIISKPCEWLAVFWKLRCVFSFFTRISCCFCI